MNDNGANGDKDNDKHIALNILQDKEKKEVIDIKKNKCKKYSNRPLCWILGFCIIALCATLIGLAATNRFFPKSYPICGTPPTSPVIQNDQGLIYSATYDVVYGRAKLNYMGLVNMKARFVVYTGAPVWQEYNCMYEVTVKFQYRDNITDWVRPYLDPIINSLPNDTPLLELPEPIFIPYASYNTSDLTGVAQQEFSNFAFKSAIYNKDGFLFFFNGTIGGSRITIMRV